MNGFGVPSFPPLIPAGGGPQGQSSPPMPRANAPPDRRSIRVMGARFMGSRSFGWDCVT